MADSTTQHGIAIIGAGFSGICLAIKLKAAGITDFVLLEKAADVGGVWRDNTYPGAACDIPTALYSYSFEHNPEWDCKWSGQAQILDYIRNAAKKYQLYSHIRFNAQVSGASWQAETKDWHIKLADDTEIGAQHLVSAVGQLHHPSVPDIEGAEQFKGAMFHSATWDHNVPLAGRRIAVIGTGASAIQFIPQLAQTAARVDIYQRSANWMLPKIDSPYADWQKWLRAKLPLLSRWDRLQNWLLGEIGILPAMHGNRLVQAIIRHKTLSRLRKTVSDPETRAALTPDYPVGAKRILFSDDYFATINRDNVKLHTGKVLRINEHTIEYEGGVSEDIDVIVFGTGFITNPFLSDMTILGRGGVDLHAHWHNGAHAYLGVCTAGFPNFFMMYGPNTNLGHNSIIQMIEPQASLIVRAVTALRDSGRRSIEVRDEIETRYDDELQQRLNKMAWTQVDSWYRDGKRITNNWAGGTLEYKRRIGNFRDEDYVYQ